MSTPSESLKKFYDKCCQYSIIQLRLEKMSYFDYCDTDNPYSGWFDQEIFILENLLYTAIWNKIDQISEEYNVTLIKIKKGDKWCKKQGLSHYLNSSYCFDETIRLGIYDDEEIKIISFFIMLGRIKMDRTTLRKGYNRYDVENKALSTGRIIALENGVSFHKRAIEWSWSSWLSMFFLSDYN